MKSRFFNALLDLLFDALFWLLGVKDDGPGAPVPTTAGRERVTRQDFSAGGNHG